MYTVNIGRSDKAGVLQGKGQSAVREKEEEFAVSAAVEREQRKGSQKQKKPQVRGKSKKRQFKVNQSCI